MVANGPLPVRIVKVKSRLFGRRKRNVWKDNPSVAYLSGPDGRRFVVWLPNLGAGAFDRPDFAAHAGFATGEWIQVGSSYSEKNVYTFAADGNDTLTITGKPASWIGQFAGVLDEERYLVDIRIPDKPGLTRLVVPRGDVIGYATGTAAHFAARLAPIFAVPIAFDRDEIVRYRGADGLVRVGSFRRRRGTAVAIRTPEGETTYVPERSVFKYLTGDPSTALFNAGWMWMDYEPPSGAVRALLDAAGRLTSLPDFVALPEDRRFRTVVRLVETMMPWSISTNEARAKLGFCLNDLMHAGAGVCRHHAAVLATILNEMGYRARVVKYIENPEAMGHAWVEVDVGAEGQTRDSFVIDLNEDKSVRRRYLVRWDAAKRADSMAAEFYERPNCEYLFADGTEG